MNFLCASLMLALAAMEAGDVEATRLDGPSVRGRIAAWDAERVMVPGQREVRVDGRLCLYAGLQTGRPLRGIAGREASPARMGRPVTRPLRHARCARLWQLLPQMVVTT